MEKDTRNKNKFRFAVLGCSWGLKESINTPIFKSLLERAKALEVNFLLFTGDMTSGVADSKFKGYDKKLSQEEMKELEKQMNDWMDIVWSVFPEHKENPERFLFPCIGEHDIGGKDYKLNESSFNSIFDLLPPGPGQEELTGYGKTVYHFDYRNTRFIIMNSARTLFGRCIISDKQLKWLEAVLEDSKNKKMTHNFVMFHHLAYPNGSCYKKSIDAIKSRRNKLWSILDKYNVTAVYCGHEQCYSRRIISDAFYTKPEGQDYFLYNSIYQITTGGAGGPLEPQQTECINNIVSPLGIYHLVFVEINGSIVTTKAIDINGTCFDSFEYDSSRASTIKMQDYFHGK